MKSFLAPQRNRTHQHSVQMQEWKKLGDRVQDPTTHRVWNSGQVPKSSEMGDPAFQLCEDYK